MKIVTLRKRREFLRVRGGGRWSTPAFVLEGKRRPSEPVEDQTDHTSISDGKLWDATLWDGKLWNDKLDVARIGFTVTKRLGNAVRRNRIRRRLKAALQQVADTTPKGGFDYVLIAREPALDITFDDLICLLEKAFDRVHRPRKKTGTARKRSAKDTPTTAQSRNEETSNRNIPRK